MTKYRNNKTTVRGITFDSQKEANEFVKLMALQDAGKIRNLKLQPEFTIQEAFRTTTGERVRAIRYRADFSYERQTSPDCNGFTYWLPVVEDVKGYRTKEYAMKKNLLSGKGIEVLEV
ncbi:MAG: DUF1064 domain-containing protein [Elusimicrobiales bacterium]|nr:DUF1064 domain-containing protein [Elusimicrobiales bacterium]